MFDSSASLVSTMEKNLRMPQRLQSGQSGRATSSSTGFFREAMCREPHPKISGMAHKSTDTEVDEELVPGEQLTDWSQ